MTIPSANIPEREIKKQHAGGYVVPPNIDISSSEGGSKKKGDAYKQAFHRANDTVANYAEKHLTATMMEYILGALVDDQIKGDNSRTKTNIPFFDLGDLMKVAEQSGINCKNRNNVPSLDGKITVSSFLAQLYTTMRGGIDALNTISEYCNDKVEEFTASEIIIKYLADHGEEDSFHKYTLMNLVGEVSPKARLSLNMEMRKYCDEEGNVTAAQFINALNSEKYDNHQTLLDLADYCQASKIGEPIAKYLTSQSEEEGFPRTDLIKLIREAGQVVSRPLSAELKKQSNSEGNVTIDQFMGAITNKTYCKLKTLTGLAEYCTNQGD
jgi:hypothetical protein